MTRIASLQALHATIEFFNRRLPTRP